MVALCIAILTEFLRIFVAYGYVFVLPKNIFLSIDEDFWLKRLHVFLVAFSVVELFSHILCSLPS